MSAPVDWKYRAFLSYAHADTRLAKRLHSQLEGFRIDKDLAGRVTPTGPVPKTLRPIFRDREDFSGGHSLTDATIAALDASAALIVLCSTTSATRPAINEEVRLFRSRHPDRPVIPVILNGTHPDNFPPALRFELTPDGTITDRPVTILGPDVQDSGDGWTLTLAKVVAGLTGLAPDDVFRRAERERRRSANIRNGIIAVLALLAVAATGSAVYAWQQLKTNEAFLEATLKSATEIVNEAVAQAEKYSVPRTATLALLTRAESLFDNMARYGHPTPELQRQKAWMLIEFARNYGILGDTTKQRQRADEASRILAALQGPDGSATASQHALAAADDERGQVLQAQGNLPEALKAYQSELVILDRLAKSEPENAGWQHDLSVPQERIGDVLREQGNLPEALKALTAALAIRDRFAKAGPGNAGWQRDLSESQNRTGDVLRALGNLPEALRAYQTALGIANGLAKADPANAAWQREVSVCHNRIGDVLRAQSNLPEALTAYQAAHTIADLLAKADPGNAGWQRDLSVSHMKIGDVRAALGNLPEAMAAYHASHDIFDRLVKADPGNAIWQRDIALSQERIGDVLVKQGNLPEAIMAYKASLTIRDHLAKADPSNAGWQRDVATSNERLGDVYSRLGNQLEARRALERALDSYELLITQNPGDVQSRVFSVVPHWRLAGLDPLNSGQHLRAALAILKPLADGNQLDANRLNWIPQIEAQLAALDR